MPRPRKRGVKPKTVRVSSYKRRSPKYKKPKQDVKAHRRRKPRNKK